MNRLVNRLLVLVLAGQLGTSAAHAAKHVVPAWLGEMHLIAQVGNDFISNYDLAVNIVVQRALSEDAIEPLPDLAERRQASARVLGQRAVLFTARQQKNIIPSDREMLALQSRILRAFDNSIDNFETTTGLTRQRLHQAVEERAIIKAFSQDLLIQGIQGTTLFSTPGTKPGAQQLSSLDQVRESLSQVVLRHLERAPLTILHPDFRREDLLDPKIAFASF